MNYKKILTILLAAVISAILIGGAGVIANNASILKTSQVSK